MDKHQRPVARTLLCLALAAAAVALTACNTVKGVGKDVEAAGEAGERAISGD